MSTILEEIKSKSNANSEVVEYVFRRFHSKAGSAKDIKVSSKIVNKVEEFLHRHRLWVYCKKMMITLQSRGIERSYLEIREEWIQKLIDYKKNHRSELEEQTRQMVHIEQVIEKCEERERHFRRELERYKQQSSEEASESIVRLEKRLKEFEEEIEFRSHVLEVQKELAMNRFPEMAEMERELCDLERVMSSMIDEAKRQAERFQIPESTALTLFNYIANDGYFTHVPEEEWEWVMNHSTSKEQTRLKEHFHYDRSQSAYLLNDEQRYVSPLQRKTLVGNAHSSGISFLDFQVKKVLNDKLKNLAFQSFYNETKAFFAYLVREALQDGILTVEEMHMVDDIAHVLKIDPAAAKDILNGEAESVQRQFVNQQMMVFYDLAMADGVMQREEAKFLVEMNQKLENQVISKVATTMESRSKDLQLNLNDEELFVDMCKMVMKDGILDSKESEMLLSYIEKRGWDKSRLQPILEKALTSQN